MEFFLISTDHLSEHLWFKDFEDYKAGMNLVAVSAFVTGIHVIAFILMSNHVHFVVEGSEEDALRFISDFKARYSLYYSHKYGKAEILRRNGVDIQSVPLAGESLERVIAYVQMNSVAANICMSADAYPWGTGRTFFSYQPEKGRSLSSLSVRERRFVVHSKTELPDNYILLDDGFISPASFVNRTFVESLFRTPKRMTFFLQSSSKARKALSGENYASFKDQNIVQASSDLCRSLYRKRDLKELDATQLAEIVRQLKYRFSADVAQLARVCDLSYEKVASILDSY